MSNDRHVVATAACLLLLAAITARANECIDCHQDPDFFARYPKLYSYYQQWLDSPHMRSRVTCDDCHGGDADNTDIETAHAGVLPMSDRASSLHYQNQPVTCGRCHGDMQREFVQSKHFDALMGERTAPTCTTCHPAMSRRPEFRIIALKACTTCHGAGNPQDLPLIVDRAEHVFNQLNIAAGLMAWTRLHFESHDWPGDSRDRMRQLDRDHREILTWVHQFNLEQTESATVELLGELRVIFDEARRAHEE